jgi:transcriptional regulator with XRE-family HTH domain
MNSNKESTEVVATTGLNAYEYKVAEMLSTGSTRKEVAEELGITISEVYQITARKGVKSKTKELTANIADETLSKHIRLLDAMIESKLEKLDSEDKTLADATNKDIVDLMNQLSKLRAENDMVDTRAKLTSEGGGYASILQSIIVNNNTTIVNNENGGADSHKKKLDIMKDSVEAEIVDE